ncbi:MAG: MerR family transcriptional regulator [Oliverpabstia sp.]|nr:MerR family transcriptional regulator [Lachnospiraceae bacterium]MDY5026664.1 MerR family transcriptional regulator [Oliverpabstia sp.]
MNHNGLFRIGEVSKLFHVSISILRHYDKIGLLKPEYTDPDTGYRYYSTRQFECLNTIRYLRALDMPLEKISGFLQNRNIDSIHNLLIEQQREVKRRRQELALIEHKIEKRLQQLEDALSSQLDVIKLIRNPARRLTAIRRELSPSNYLDLEYSIRELEQSEENSVTFLGKVGLGISAKNLNHHRYRPYDIVFILLDEEDQFNGKTIFLPEETCLSIRFQGGHERAPEYYEKLMSYIEQNHYSVTGFSKEITMIDYGLTDDVTRFVTEIQIPISSIFEPHQK